MFVVAKHGYRVVQFLLYLDLSSTVLHCWGRLQGQDHYLDLVYLFLTHYHLVTPEIIEQSTTCLNVTCCLVSIQYSQTAVLSVYRSPSTCCTAAMTELQSILMQLSPHVKYLIVAGDFNIDLKSNSSISKEYRNLLDDFCLTQHISEPSRVSHGSATLIDHISGSDQLPVIRSYQAVGLSDHYMQGVDFGAPTCPQEVRTM